MIKGREERRGYISKGPLSHKMIQSDTVLLHYYRTLVNIISGYLFIFTCFERNFHDYILASLHSLEEAGYLFD